MERKPRNATINHHTGTIRSSSGELRRRASEHHSSAERHTASERSSAGERRTSAGRTSAGTRSAQRSSAGSSRRASSGRAASSGASSARRASSGSRNIPARNWKKRRRAEETRRKRRLLFGGGAALIVVLAVIVLIVVSSLVVPEADKLNVESSSSTQILTWKGKPKNISYQIYRKSTDSDFELVHTIPAGGDPSFVSSDLQSASLYEYKIVAVKGEGDKARESKGVTISAYTLPETLTECSALTMSKDSLTISWPEKQKKDGYELQLAASEDMKDATVLSYTAADAQTNEAAGTTMVTIPNLPTGSSYFIKVRCFVGDHIYSEWSDVFQGRVTQAIDMTGIDPNKPMVALTYDDGPDKGPITNKILDALKEVGGHATFFQLGYLAEAYPEVVQRIVDEGSEIGCHTYDHEHMGDAVTTEDIVRANDAIEKACGVRPDVFRSPGGSTTDLIYSTCKSEGQAIFHWSVDTRDWSSRDADSVVSIIKEQTEDGDIILMHNIYDSSAEASVRIIPWLAEQGYQLVTVAQLIQAKTNRPPKPGVQYFDASMTSED